MIENIAESISMFLESQPKLFGAFIESLPDNANYEQICPLILERLALKLEDEKAKDIVIYLKDCILNCEEADKSTQYIVVFKKILIEKNQTKKYYQSS